MIRITATHATRPATGRLPRHRVFVSLALLVAVAAAAADDPDWELMDYTMHFYFQAVDGDGFGTFPLTAPVKMRGVIINRSEQMLPGEPSATPYMGGIWQVYVQAVGDADVGGTALWMGQNIGKLVGNHPAGSYTDQEWLAELDRLSHDPITGHEFQPGDYVEIRARAPGLSFRGKTNVNEQHSNNPAMDFDVYLLEADYGVPEPILVPLSYVKDENDDFIFDPQRLTGAEYFQGSLVRFPEVSFIDTSNWAPDAELVVQDDTGRTFPVKLGLDEAFTLCGPPAGPVDVIGVFDQEDYDPDDGYKSGYRLWVRAYAGGIVSDRAPGDVNCDGVVDFDDINPFVLALSGEEAYLAEYPCCVWLNADCNDDGQVDFDDINAFVGLLGT